jgi:hypothetical protein
MSGIEATTTDGGTTGTSQTRNDASSAAERLGGPVEDEPRQDTARRAEPRTDRQTDAGAGEGERGTDTTAGEAEQGADTARRVETDTDRDGDTDATKRTALIEPESAEGYNRRWNELKSEFVDEPRSAVRGANELVGEVLDELEELFRRQRADLEHGLDSEETTTEDLRQALRRYRSFFDRLLTF